MKLTLKVLKISFFNEIMGTTLDPFVTSGVIQLHTTRLSSGGRSAWWKFCVQFNLPSHHSSNPPPLPPIPKSPDYILQRDAHRASSSIAKCNLLCSHHYLDHYRLNVRKEGVENEKWLWLETKPFFNALRKEAVQTFSLCHRRVLNAWMAQIADCETLKC